MWGKYAKGCVRNQLGRGFSFNQWWWDKLVSSLVKQQFSHCHNIIHLELVRITYKNQIIIKENIEFNIYKLLEMGLSDVRKHTEN